MALKLLQLGVYCLVSRVHRPKAAFCIGRWRGKSSYLKLRKVKLLDGDCHCLKYLYLFSLEVVSWMAD